MTTKEIRERLEELAIKWSEEANGFADDFNGNDVSNAKMNALDSCANALTSLLSEMGDGWIETATNPPSEEMYSDNVYVLAWYAQNGSMDKERAASVRSCPGVYTHWQPLPEGPKR